MTNNSESLQFRKLLLLSLNSEVEIVTNFGSITGEVVPAFIYPIPLDYVVVKESNGDFVYVPLTSIVSLILLKEEGDL